VIVGLVVLLLTSLWLLLWLLPGVWAAGSGIMDRRRWSRVGGLCPPGERALAEQRAARLLRELLDEREYQQLSQRGYLEVKSPSHQQRIYRIPGHNGRVRVYEDGRALMELCVQPVVSLPHNDVILLHKLMIEGNEQGYLALANEVPLPLPPRFYDRHGWHWFEL